MEWESRVWSGCPVVDLVEGSHFSKSQLFIVMASQLHELADTTTLPPNAFQNQGKIADGVEHTLEKLSDSDALLALAFI